MSLGNGTKNGSTNTSHSSDLEDAIARVSGVHGARVVVDSVGSITEVHVLASSDRTAKQIMRDVTTTIQAGFGLKLDYRIVSVARLDAPAPTKATNQTRRKNSARPAVDGVAASSRGRTTEVSVQLKHEGKTYEGSARGPVTSALSLAAAAAVDSGREFLGDNAIEVRSAEIVKTADGDLVALVMLRATTLRGAEPWCGSALVRNDPSDAIVRATFSAMNRALPGETC